MGIMSGVYTGSLDAKPDAQGAKRLVDSPAGATYADSPNGGQLLFLRGTALMAQPFDTRRLELTGRAVQMADRLDSSLFLGSYSASNSGMLAFAVTGGNKRQLTWFDRSGRVLGHPGEAEVRDELALSPDGTRVVEGRSDDQGMWTVWMLDLDRGSTTRLTFDGGGGDAVWSPDGREIIYSPERRSVAGHLSQAGQRRRAGGIAAAFRRNQVDTWTGRAMGNSCCIHSAGRIATRTSGASRSWATASRRPTSFRLFLNLRANSLLTGTGWFTLPMNREPGKCTCSHFPMAAGGKWPVSNGGGNQPRWSRDGKELFYFTPNETLMAVQREHLRRNLPTRNS